MLGNGEYKGEKQISNQGENVLWAILEQGSPFLKNFLEFYWSMVDLQSCVSFEYTAKWISYKHTYIYSFLDFFPM